MVLLTTTRYKIEPFARQLIRLMDHLKAGRINNIAKLTRPGKDKSRAMLFAAIAKTVNDGERWRPTTLPIKRRFTPIRILSIICWPSMNTLVVCGRRDDADVPDLTRRMSGTCLAHHTLIGLNRGPRGEAVSEERAQCTDRLQSHALSLGAGAFETSLKDTRLPGPLGSSQESGRDIGLLLPASGGSS